MLVGLSSMCNSNVLHPEFTSNVHLLRWMIIQVDKILSSMSFSCIPTIFPLHLKWIRYLCNDNKEPVFMLICYAIEKDRFSDTNEKKEPREEVPSKQKPNGNIAACNPYYFGLLSPTTVQKVYIYIWNRNNCSHYSSEIIGSPFGSLMEIMNEDEIQQQHQRTKTDESSVAWRRFRFQCRSLWLIDGMHSIDVVAVLR